MRNWWRWIMLGFLGITFVIGCAAMTAWAARGTYSPLVFHKQTYRDVTPPSSSVREYHAIISQGELVGGWLRIFRDTEVPGLFAWVDPSLGEHRYSASEVALWDQSWKLHRNYHTDKWAIVFWFEGFNAFGGRAPLWLIGVVLLSPSLTWVIAGVLVPTQRRRKRLANHQCPHCGYNLMGSSSSTCPECGR